MVSGSGEKEFASRSPDIDHKLMIYNGIWEWKGPLAVDVRGSFV